MKTTPILASTLLALTVQQAIAQEAGSQPRDGDELEMIVVTAQKREQNIIDVPLSVTAYDEKFLDKIGATELDKVAAVTPGFNMESQDRFAPAFTIRGVSSNEFAPSGEMRVSVFQDGIPATQTVATYGELFDVNRIEIDRGPQSTLHGRSALNGSVSIFQNRANLGRRELQVQGGIGDYDYRRYAAIANIPLSDNFGIRVGAQHKERDGFVKDTDGGSFNAINADAYRLAARWLPADGVEVNLVATRDVDDTDSSVPFKSNRILPRDNRTGAVIGDLDFWTPLHLSTFGPNFPDLYFKRYINNVSGTVDLRLNDTFSVTSVTGWRKFNSCQAGDMDGMAAEIIEYNQCGWGKQVSEELRLNFTNLGIFDGFAGVSYVKANNGMSMDMGFDERGIAMLGSIRAREPNGMTNAEINAALGPLANYLKAFHQDSYAGTASVKNWDFFADVTAKLTDTFQVFAGGRSSRGSVDATNRGWLPYGPSNLTGAGIFFQPSPGGVAASVSHDSSLTTGRAGFRWQLAPQVNFYGVYGVGKRPDVASVSTTGVVTVAPAETLKSAEIGLKYAAFGNRLVGSAAVYKQDYRNFQTQAYVGGTVVFQNAGSADAPGIELQNSFRVNGYVTGFVTYAYNKARFKDGPLKGNRPRNSPDNLASLGLDIEIPLSVGGTLDITPVYSWKSKFFMWDDDDRTDLQQRSNAANSDDRVDEFQNAYGLLRLNVGYTSDGGRWSVNLIGDNLLDEKYLLDAGNTGDNFGIPTFIAGSRRNVRAEFAYKF
ncbi:MAG: TonB-dependent receptor [Steroidobacteraceae bacterium]